MKCSPAIAALALCLVAPDTANAGDGSSFERGGRFGLGVGGVGWSNGLSAKIFLGEALAAQAVVGVGYGSAPAVSVDLLLAMPHLIEASSFSANWNVGLGATALGGGPSLGGQGLIGVAAQLKPIPVEFVVELRGTVLVGYRPEGVWFDVGAGGHIRYFF